MDDDGDDTTNDDYKRRTRNLSEKKRRDQFNMLVQELGTMISTNNRKMDKSTILRSTIYFLKNHNEITARARAHDVQEDWKPAFLTNEEFTYLLLEAVEGFVIVFSATGRISYVSESVASLLGHNPNDIINKSLYDLIYEDDRTNLYGLLQHPDTSEYARNGSSTENEITFQCHLRRGSLDYRDEVTYELIQFNGYFRTDIEQNENCNLNFEEAHEASVVYFCTGKLGTPQLIRDVSLVDADRNEFISRHSLEWKFLFLDHRAPPIIGYLPFEVLGTSGYDYYHFDDLEKVIMCHEALMQKGELTSCYYRFLTKGQQWIWLQSRFYITYHQWHSKPEFVVCTHRVVDYMEVQVPTKQENVDQDASTDCEPSQSGLREPSPENAPAVSPSYMSESSEAYGNYISQLQSQSQSHSQSQSVKSMPTSADSVCATVASAGTAVTAAASWQSRSPYLSQGVGSDTASISGDSRSSQRNSSQDTPNVQESTLVPQHNIGAQYLEPVPYVGPVGMSGVLPMPLPPLPVIVSPNQAQLQEQLQRTHRELQHMIYRQQEELRMVKEQLMLARLGIFQPMISVNDPYGHNEEILHMPRMQPQIVYDGTQPRALGGFPPHQVHQPHQQHQLQADQIQPHQSESQLSLEQQMQPHQSQSQLSPVQQMQPHQSKSQLSPVQQMQPHQSQSQLSTVQQMQPHQSQSHLSSMQQMQPQPSQSQLSPVQQMQPRQSQSQLSTVHQMQTHQSQSQLSPVQQMQPRQSQSQLSPVQQMQPHQSQTQLSSVQQMQPHQSQSQLSTVQQMQPQQSQSHLSSMQQMQPQQSQSQLSPVQQMQPHQSQPQLSPTAQMQAHQSQLQLSPVQQMQPHQSQSQLSPENQSVAQAQAQLSPMHQAAALQTQAHEAPALQAQVRQAQAQQHLSPAQQHRPPVQDSQLHCSTEKEKQLQQQQSPVQQSQAFQVQVHLAQTQHSQAHQEQAIHSAQKTQGHALQNQKRRANAHHAPVPQAMQAQAHQVQALQAKVLQAQARHSAVHQAQAQTLQTQAFQAQAHQAQGHQAQMHQAQHHQVQSHLAHQAQMQQALQQSPAGHSAHLGQKQFNPNMSHAPR